MKIILFYTLRVKIKTVFNFANCNKIKQKINKRPRLKKRTDKEGGKACPSVWKFVETIQAHKDEKRDNIVLNGSHK